MTNKRIRQKQLIDQNHTEKTIVDYEKYLIDLLKTEREKINNLGNFISNKVEYNEIKNKIHSLSAIHQHLRDFQLNK